MTKETKQSEDVIESTVTDSTTETNNETNSKSDKHQEMFCRFLYTILFFILGWLSLWVFSFVVIIQFGFLLISGKVNTNLKGFNKEVGLFLFDIMKYLSFQTNTKPFPFRNWSYDENDNNSKENELSQSNTVEVSK